MATSLAFLKNLLPSPNIQAALKTIRHTEGTGAADGYNYLFGSNANNSLRFTDFSAHPNNLQTHSGISSTAAGAYQILYKTYVELCSKYGIADFTPETQDLLCVAIFDEIGVLLAVSKGRIMQDTIMTALSKQWASLPYSPYGQPEHSITDVRKYYTWAGGNIG